MARCTCVYKTHLHDPSCVIDLFVYKEVSAALNIFGKCDEPSSHLKPRLKTENLNRRRIIVRNSSIKIKMEALYD